MSQKKKDEAVWEDCGCPLSMAIGDFAPDINALTSLPHMCTIGSDESAKHYIFDRPAFDKLTTSPPNSPLTHWTQTRLLQHRLFVAKPPTRPPLPPEPWRYDEPPLYWTLPSGWRTWEPTNKSLVFSDENPIAEYDTNLDTFFLYMSIKDPAKQAAMRAGVEAWVMACGDGDALIKRRPPSRHARCFVTSSGELFASLFAAGDKLNGFLKDFKIRGRPRHLRRFVDLRMDAKVRVAGCGHAFNP